MANQSLKQTAIRTILPALMGAAGALLAALAPAYHAAFCTASVFGV